MMKICLAILIVFSCLQLNAQKKIKQNLGNSIEEYYQTKGEHSQYKKFYKNHLQVEGFYKNGKRDSVWLFYNISGKPIIKAHFKQGENSGIWEYYSNDTLISKLKYNSETRIDTFIGYFPNGIIAQIKVKDRNTNRSWFIKYYNNGIKFEEGYLNNDTLTGPLKKYNRKGEYITGILYKKGNPYTLIYSNDTLAKGFEYYKGSLKSGNGNLFVYNSDSTEYLYSELNYRNGYLNGIYKKYYKKNLIFIEGQFMDDYMVNEWKLYDKKGKIVKSKYYSLSNKIESDPVNGYSSFFGNFSIENIPKFLNKSTDEFRFFIAKNLNYPLNAAEQGIQGRVNIQFTINALGEVIDVQNINSINEDLDKEAKRIVSISPNWEPGYQYYLPVKVQFTFPVNFIIH